MRVHVNHHRRLQLTTELSQQHNTLKNLKTPNLQQRKRERKNGTLLHLVGRVLALADPVQLQSRAVPSENLIEEQKGQVSAEWW